jgi:hypothetical protein
MKFSSLTSSSLDSGRSFHKKLPDKNLWIWNVPFADGHIDELTRTDDKADSIVFSFTNLLLKTNIALNK